MSRLADLPPDQHATLSLLLSQRKGYAEVATLLSISAGAVHDRAQAALAVLAPRQARELSPERRAEVGDYLLGQQASVAERLATRTYLEGSAPARAWASAVSAEIGPLSSAPLPEIPRGPAASAAAAPDARDIPSATGPAEREPAALAPGHSGRAPSQHAQPSSRLGGALLLGGVVAAVIVAVILLVGGGGGGSHSKSTAATSSSASSTAPASKAATGSGGPTEDNRITLTSPDPASKAAGVVEILSEGGKHAFYLAAEHLPPSHGFFYAVWLYNSPSSHEALSKSPPVGSNGRLQGGALLPANAGSYHTMLLTRETSERPSNPGPVVLSGSFSLGH
jgi:hypothetical protein